MAINRRLIFWLIKAYIKKSGKTLVFSFIIGLLFFFLILFAARYFSVLFPASKKTTIGVVGSYTQDTLPLLITSKLSQGLTAVDEKGNIKPDLAQSWQLENNGKVYIFHLKKNQHFNNGDEVTAQTINYNFSDVTVEKPDKYTIVFKLKDAYSPFLVTVSRPVFEKGFIGVGDYRIGNVKLNGNFVQSLTLASVKNRFDTIHFLFYPSEEALKMAFVLGEVSQIDGLTSPAFRNTSFETFPRIQTTKQANTSRLVTLFFNTTDSTLSDKKLRFALSYALPNTFSGGKKTFLPYPSDSVYYNTDLPEKKQDYTHAKQLMSDNHPKTLTIKTLKIYHKTAEEIARSWKQIGIDTKIEDVESVPSSFQIFLGHFNMPKDPDQYTLWHSGQINNISRYKNLRIDKLLEDGRKTADIAERQKIYFDFQKYLLEDAPAAFLYFPVEYQIKRS